MEYLHKIEIIEKWNTKQTNYIIRLHAGCYQICYYDNKHLYSIYSYKRLGNAANKLKDIVNSYNINFYNINYWYCKKELINKLYLKHINNN